MDEFNHKNLDAQTNTFTYTQRERERETNQKKYVNKKNDEQKARLIPSSNKFKLFYGVSFSQRFEQV